MKQYEITFLTNDEATNSAVGELLKKEIETLGGKSDSTIALGRKQLVYPIKKTKEAYFSSISFDLEPAKLNDLNKKISQEDEILRYLIIIVKKVAIPPIEIEEKKITAKKTVDIIAKQEQEKITPVVKTAKEKTTKTTLKKEDEIPEMPKVIKKPVIKPRKAKVEAPVEKELSDEERLKTLDAKLDELLKE